MMATIVTRAFALLLLAAVALCTPDAIAQDPPPKPTFSSEAALVVLQVTVFDRHGDSVRLPVIRTSGTVAPLPASTAPT